MISLKVRAQFTPNANLGQYASSKFAPAAIDAANAGAAIILGHALSIVHVRSGELRDSGHVEQAVSDGKTAVAQVVFDSEHAAFDEFGTGRRGESSPMAGPGPYRQDWAGMVPIPYLRPSLDTSTQEVNGAIAGTLSASLAA